MTEELKARIAQINASTAPAGYKKTKVGIVPEEWEICHFKKQFARLRRKNTEGNTNVLTISAQYGLINQEEFFKKEVASEDKSNYYLLYRGDFAYNKSYSNGYPFGAFKMLDRYDSGVVSPLYICFTPTESNECPAFYVQYFENGMMNREIQAVAQEGARNHGLLNISIDDFFNSYLLCPPLPEQQKIAEILTAQDAVIALMQKQIELLQKQKKALMQKLLSGDLRVGSGEWKKVRLNEICTFINGRAYKQEELLDKGKYPVLRVGNLFTKGDWYYSDLELSDEKYINNGDLIFAWSASFSPFIWNGAKVIYHYHIWKIDDIRGVDKMYLYFSLQYDVEKMQTQTQGGTMAHITKETMEKRKIIFPPLPEQEKIAEILSAQDKEIELLQQKLALEQQKKKALMQLLLTGKVRVKT